MAVIWLLWSPQTIGNMFVFLWAYGKCSSSGSHWNSREKSVVNRLIGGILVNEWRCPGAVCQQKWGRRMLRRYREHLLISTWLFLLKNCEVQLSLPIVCSSLDDTKPSQLVYNACLDTNLHKPSLFSRLSGNKIFDRLLPDILIAYQVGQISTTLEGISVWSSSLQVLGKKGPLWWSSTGHFATITPFCSQFPTLGNLPSPFHASARQARRAVKG